MVKKISIIIPVYNGENYVSEAIESALSQDYPAKEVIVVNDGSHDRTADILAQFGSQIVTCHQSNVGLGASRNVGVRMATGSHLAFLDHDDLWASNKLSCQMKLIESYGEQDPMVFSEVKQFICARLSEKERRAIRVNSAILPGYIASSLLLSKKRFEQVGYFIEKKQLGEFVEWYSRALAFAIPVVMLDEVMAYRRLHQKNMGRQRNQYQQTDYLKILKAGLDKRRGIL